MIWWYIWQRQTKKQRTPTVVWQQSCRPLGVSSLPSTVPTTLPSTCAKPVILLILNNAVNHSMNDNQSINQSMIAARHMVYERSLPWLRQAGMPDSGHSTYFFRSQQPEFVISHSTATGRVVAMDETHCGHMCLTQPGCAYIELACVYTDRCYWFYCWLRF